MYKIVFVVLMVFSFNANARKLDFTTDVVKDSLKVVGNVKRGPYLIAELSVLNNETANQYKLRYLDASTQLLKSIEFVSTQSQLDELYLFFTKMLSEKNGVSNEIQIDKYKFNATTQKMIGFKNVLITINESSNFGISEKELNKLFGK